MIMDREFSLRRWSERFAWGALAFLFLVVIALPLNDAERATALQFLLFVAAYLAATFRVLFPRSNYSARVIYATLLLDLLVIGALNLLLTEHVHESEIFFIPLIVAAALISGRRGTLFLALAAAATDWGLEAVRKPDVRHSAVDQILVGGVFLLTGLIVTLLVEHVQRRARESADATVRAAESERQRRADAERSARHWQIVNAVGLHVQQESRAAPIFETMGAELKALGLDFIVALWDEPGKTLRLEYLSLAQTPQKFLERLSGISIRDFRLDVRVLPDYAQALATRRASFGETSDEVLLRVLPALPPSLTSQIFQAMQTRRRILAPLIANDQAIGMFRVWGSDLNEADVPAMTALAQHVASALDRTRLFAQLQKRAAQLELVSTIAEQTGAIYDADELMRQVVHQIRERFGYETAGILMVDRERNELYVAAGLGALAQRQGVTLRQPIDRGIAGWVARNGASYLARDVRADPLYASIQGDDLVRSQLCVPLRRGTEIIGVLGAQSSRVDAFDESDQAAMETLANQIAIALVNARLYRDSRRRLAEMFTLSEVSRAIASTLDVQELGRRAIDTLEAFLAYGYSAILLIQPDGRMIPLALSTQNAGPEFETRDREHIQQFDPRVGKGITGDVAQTGQPARVGDVTRDPRYLAVRANVKSELCVPLQIGERVIGILNIESPVENAYTEDDERLLTTLASPLAIAIENARLYARARDEADVKAALLRELSHRVKNNLTAVAGLLYLGLDDASLAREQVLSETLARVQSMVVAHTLLSNSPRARVDLLELGHHVLSDSIRHLTLPGQVVPFAVRGEAIEISARQASSVALVLNELITNALKHTRHPATTRLELAVTREPSRAVIELFNHGDTLPEDFSNSASNGIGLRLIRTIVEKDLDGQFDLVSRASPRGVAGIIAFAPEE
ncbi:MAG: GAF domain-containing protein [Chloroflexi bacterium]|nr:GAF domain-containing protein [Chloroflexota bacterium]